VRFFGTVISLLYFCKKIDMENNILTYSQIAVAGSKTIALSKKYLLHAQ